MSLRGKQVKRIQKKKKETSFHLRKPPVKKVELQVILPARESECVCVCVCACLFIMVNTDVPIETSPLVKKS